MNSPYAGIPKISFPRKAFLFLLISLLPPAFLASLILKYVVELPFCDDYSFLTLVDHFYDSKLTLPELWGQNNEHRMIFGNLLLLPAVRLTSWTTLDLLWLNLACAAGAFAILAREIFLLARRRCLPQILWFIPLLSLMAFSPRQWQNWYWVIQFVYFLTFLLGIAALAILCRESFSWNHCCLAAGFLTASTFSQGQGFAFWAAAFAIILMRDDLAPGMRIRVAVLGTFFWGGIAWIYSIGYIIPRAIPPVDHFFKHPWNAAIYYLNFLGGSLDDGFYAKYLGLIGLLFFMIFFSFWWKKTSSKKDGLFFFGLAVLSLAAGALITVGRSGFSPLQALASRYALFTYPFWISTGVFVTLAFQELQRGKEKKRSWVGALTALLIVAFCLLALRISCRSLPGVRHFYDKKIKARNALLQGTPEKALNIVCGGEELLKRDLEIMKKWKLSLYKTSVSGQKA